MKKEYYYEATIKDAESGEIIIKVSAFSQEGLEEEQGKSKWTEAIAKYEAMNTEEEAMDKELKEDNLADKKIEDPPAFEEDLEAEEELAATKENL